MKKSVCVCVYFLEQQNINNLQHKRKSPITTKQVSKILRTSKEVFYFLNKKAMFPSWIRKCVCVWRQQILDYPDLKGKRLNKYAIFPL